MVISCELSRQLTTLLDTAVVAVSGCGVPVNLYGIVHGDVVWDDCCEGYLFVRVVRTNVVDTFPQPTQVPTDCVLKLATLVELGILRCAPMMDSNGNPPSVEAQTEFALDMIRDKSIIFNLIKNYNPDCANYPAVIDSWNPLPISGGCGGGAWQFFINVVLCQCGPD
jgi:hypothetical protein